MDLILETNFADFISQKVSYIPFITLLRYLHRVMKNSTLISPTKSTLTLFTPLEKMDFICWKVKYMGSDIYYKLNTGKSHLKEAENYDKFYNRLQFVVRCFALKLQQDKSLKICMCKI